MDIKTKSHCGLLVYYTKAFKKIQRYNKVDFQTFRHYKAKLPFTNSSFYIKSLSTNSNFVHNA